MKLTTKILASLAISCAAFAAQAAADSYLYWMAGDTIYNQFTKQAVDYSYIRVNYGGAVDKFEATDIQGGSWLAPSYSPSSGSSGAMISAADAKQGGSYWGAFEYVASKPFVFELLGSDASTIVGYLSTTLVPSSAIASGTNPSGATPYMLTSVVPEPTSGLLMLLGVAGLALKRKRA